MDKWDLQCPKQQIVPVKVGRSRSEDDLMRLKVDVLRREGGGVLAHDRHVGQAIPQGSQILEEGVAAVDDFARGGRS